jgi:oligopeptide transport system substrate-binding protein
MKCNGKCSAKLLLIFTCLMTMLLTACGNNMGISKSVTNVPTPPINGAPKAPYEQQVFRSPIIGTDIATLDPALTTDIYSNQAISMVFNGLLRLDDNLQIQPELAQSWSLSSDGLQWTFHLRSNLTFSDGTPLTSKDVAYSIDRDLAKAINNYVIIKDTDKLNAGQIKTVIGDSILIPDANTVIFKLSKKVPYFLYTLTVTSDYIVEKSLIDKYGSNWTDHLMKGGGAGPFIPLPSQTARYQSPMHPIAVFWR